MRDLISVSVFVFLSCENEPNDPTTALFVECLGHSVKAHVTLIKILPNATLDKEHSEKNH